MAPAGTRLPRLCGGRAGVRVCSPSLRLKPKYNSVKNVHRNEGNGCVDQKKLCSDEGRKSGNRIMVVVDSSIEAKGALEWALSYNVQSQDTLILLHVAKPSKHSADSSGKINLRAYELLHSMKNMCQKRRPGVKVEVVLMEGKEKGAIIVEEAKQQKVSMLVLGQRKQSILWRLIKRWRKQRIGRGAVEYCIQNANCMAIAVRRKSIKHGGYLITTKKHKNFWLLA